MTDAAVMLIDLSIFRRENLDAIIFFSDVSPVILLSVQNLTFWIGDLATSLGGGYRFGVLRTE